MLTRATLLIALVSIFTLGATQEAQAQLFDPGPGHYELTWDPDSADPNLELTVAEDGSAIDSRGHYRYFDESVGGYCHVEAPTEELTECIRFYENGTFKIFVINYLTGQEFMTKSGLFVQTS